MQNKKKLRVAIFGAGFWAQYQIAGWQELKNVEIVALYNRTKDKGLKLTSQFHIPSFYNDPKELLAQEHIDCVDIITSPDSHESLVELVANHGTPVICQKPLAPTFAAAKHMVKITNEAKIPFMVHENWRWQAPIRALKKEINQGSIGNVFRARINYSNNFPVFINQPFLKELQQFMLMDMGTHILDVARFLFGEAKSVYCQIASVTKGIKGEDVATISLKMRNGTHCSVEMSYASILAEDTFPQTLILAEGEKGSVELKKDYLIITTTKQETKSYHAKPRMYPWINPQYALVQSGIVEANRNFLESLQGKTTCETTGKDNLKTLQLVFSSYESAKTNQAVII